MWGGRCRRVSPLIELDKSDRGAPGALQQYSTGWDTGAGV